ncbi:MAG TPA: alpha/beta hydrolase [Thermoanaerobaculia bacterium]|jgi:pimeloyl-ACP methyl ester carboxylesterase|nr:alpha/beta hydrolase [Thermoanaerobaculia bacterium]
MSEIRSRQGLPIHIDVDARREARALVVVVHGFKGFKDWGFFPWIGEYLCDAGFAVLRFNMSGIAYTTQIHDVLDVVDHAQSRFRGLPLFLLGHSLGGGVALLASREIEDLAGVVIWSAISHVDRWDDETPATVRDDYEAHRDRLNVLEAAARLRVPLLAVHGARDQTVPLDESRQIIARATDSSLLVIEAASHTFNAIHPLVHIPRELEYAAAVSAHFVGAYA